MDELFNRYGYWKVLAFFLKRPNSEVYVRELARTLTVSPASANSALAYLYKLKILNRNKKGPAHFYNLNNDIPLVQSLKKAYTLFFLEEMNFVDLCVKADPNIISLLVYGSFANGTYDEKSDFDILVIGGDKMALMETAKLLEKEVIREVNIECFSVSSWQKLKDAKNVFYNEVINNHILLLGVPPV